MICRRGCALTGCSSIPPRLLKCCGVHLDGVSIRSRPRQCVSAIRMCCQCHLYQISASNLMPTSSWLLMLLLHSNMFCSTSADRYAARGVLWQRTLCWRCSCTRCQQSWLLQHSTGRGLSVIHWSTPVSAQCCHSSRVPGKTVRTCDSTSPWLVEGPGKNQVPSLCSDVLHGTALSYLA